MTVTLVDSNVLLDIATEDARWADWSANALARAADEGGLAINPLIYAIAGYRVLTRDGRRYRTYFPTVRLLSPHGQ